MSRFLNSVDKDVQPHPMHGEPHDLDGARPVPGVLTKAFKDVKEFARRASEAPISLSDLVSSLIVIRQRGFYLHVTPSLLLLMPQRT
jgi:hypothetical protein